ncbi:hypothetical protein BSL78_14910 [Apostichopus japonicus]|uniref:CCHC-type domain-containing protein n=1 Tax=Stichopus japonicus TaxID=307972 RepID=A0A2G8KJP7_STIJA|nr:hypothetical protein BSL78_14910 [Apostichopus japonicus]
MLNDLPNAFHNFEQYCKLIFSGPLLKKTGPEKVTFLLLWLGQEGITIFNSWELTDQDKAAPDTVFGKFKTHFEPKSNFRLNRFHLHNYKQQSHETTDDFVTRCKIQAKKCKLTDEALQEKLIEQLILGTKHKKVQESLLGKDEKHTLDNAIDIARTHEATQLHMEELTNSSSVNVNAVRRYKPNTASRSPQCGRCGLNHNDGEYPALGTKCNKCGKIGHWKRVCRSKSKPQLPSKRFGKTPKNKKWDKRDVNELSQDQDQKSQRSTD